MHIQYYCVQSTTKLPAYQYQKRKEETLSEVSEMVIKSS